MPVVDVNSLNNIFNELVVKNKKPANILIGYKIYAELMDDRRFFEEVVGSAMEPSKRRYRNIKIQVTQDNYQLEVRCLNE